MSEGPLLVPELTCRWCGSWILVYERNRHEVECLAQIREEHDRRLSRMAARLRRGDLYWNHRWWTPIEELTEQDEQEKAA